MRTFRGGRGLPVVVRSTAERVGEIKHFIVEDGYVRALHVEGGRRHDALVEFSDVVSFGDDAVVLDAEDSLREPADDREAQALRGELSALDKRVLDDRGDECGDVSDVVFDPADGRIETIQVGDHAISGARLRGVGSYAMVVTAASED
jgi:uncharacterized protein YrrD